jgi:hypothetical protein
LANNCGHSCRLISTIAMAYVRGSLDHRSIENELIGISIGDYDNNQNAHRNDKKKPDGHKAQKQLIIFTMNISFLSPLFRYFVLAFGMFFFMCLYGYFQELVVYGWFNRKLSLFCTFLHFLGCSFFAQLQYDYSGKTPLSSTAKEIGTNAVIGSSPSSHNGSGSKVNSISSAILLSNSQSHGHGERGLKGIFYAIFNRIKSYIMKLQVRK